MDYWQPVRSINVKYNSLTKRIPQIKKIQIETSKPKRLNQYEVYLIEFQYTKRRIARKRGQLFCISNSDLLINLEGLTSFSLVFKNIFLQLLIQCSDKTNLRSWKPTTQ